MQHVSDLDHDYFSSSKSARQVCNAELSEISRFLKNSNECDAMSDGLHETLRKNIRLALNNNSTEELMDEAIYY